MKKICKLDHNSILRDDIEGVKHFSWETIWLELERHVPTLLALIKKLLSRPNKPLTCFIISQILKQRLPCMGLVQRAISVLLYGNGASKQVLLQWYVNVIVLEYFFRYIIACSDYRSVYLTLEQLL